MEEVVGTEEDEDEEAEVEELKESGKEKLNDFLNKIPQQTIEEICSARSQVSGNKIIINFTYCSQISTAVPLTLSFARFLLLARVVNLRLVSWLLARSLARLRNIYKESKSRSL